MSNLLKELDFEIIENKVYVGNDYQEADKYKSIQKQSGELLSIMKESYKPFYVKDFKNITERLGSISGFNIEGYQKFKNGKIILSYLKNNTGYSKVGDFDIDTYLVLGNSFDGSSQIFLSNTSKVLFCQNQFSKLMKTKFKHTASSEFKLNEMVASIEDFFKEKEELINQFNIWNDISISQDTAKVAIERIVDWDNEVLGNNSQYKANKAEEIKFAIQKETNDFGNSLWGLMSGFTYYSTHLLNKDKSKNNYGAVVGNQARFNNKAFDVVKELELAL